MNRHGFMQQKHYLTSFEMKRALILIFALSLSNTSFAQDPTCTYTITLQEVNDSLYTYQFFLQDDSWRPTLDSMRSYLRKGINPGGTTENAVMESEEGKKVLIAYSSEYCYPRDEPDQLRIVVARKSKVDSSSVELMYTYTRLDLYTEILIPAFREGKRDTEIYQYKERYLSEEPKQYDSRPYWVFNKRLIVIK